MSIFIRVIHVKVDHENIGILIDQQSNHLLQLGVRQFKSEGCDCMHVPKCLVSVPLSTLLTESSCS